jgi:hypothetical protein
MDLEGTEASNDCAGEGQERFNRPKLVSRQSLFGSAQFWFDSQSEVLEPAVCIVSSRYLATTSEQTENFMCAVVIVIQTPCVVTTTWQYDRAKIPMPEISMNTHRTLLS